jgi:hypothetical protein
MLYLAQTMASMINFSAANGDIVLDAVIGGLSISAWGLGNVGYASGPIVVAGHATGGKTGAGCRAISPLMLERTGKAKKIVHMLFFQNSVGASSRLLFNHARYKVVDVFFFSRSNPIANVDAYVIVHYTRAYLLVKFTIS